MRFKTLKMFYLSKIKKVICLTQRNDVFQHLFDLSPPPPLTFKFTPNSKHYNRDNCLLICNIITFFQI
jgi:hypothetical protein